MVLSVLKAGWDRWVLSVIDGQERLWCAEMMKCLSDPVPDYVERVKLRVLSKSASENKRVDSLYWTFGVLGRWSVGMAFLQIEEKRHWIQLVMPLMMHGRLNVDHSVQSIIDVLIQSIGSISCIRRLRLGSHWLIIVTGRWTDGGIALAHI